MGEFFLLVELHRGGSVRSLQSRLFSETYAMLQLMCEDVADTIACLLAIVVPHVTVLPVYWQ